MTSPGSASIADRALARSPSVRAWGIAAASSPAVSPIRWTLLTFGPLEDPQLRVAVGLEGTVAVEMVGLEVQQHGDLASQLVHVLELEAGKLADDPGARLDLAVELGQCAAHVSGDRRARHRAQELA